MNQPLWISEEIVRVIHQDQIRLATDQETQESLAQWLRQNSILEG